MFLEVINSPTRQLEVLEHFRNEKINTFERIKELFPHLKVFAKSGLWFIILVIIPVGCTELKEFLCKF